jgi:hypothetical protein
LIVAAKIGESFHFRFGFGQSGLDTLDTKQCQEKKRQESHVEEGRLTIEEEVEKLQAICRGNFPWQSAGGMVSRRMQARILASSLSHLEKPPILPSFPFPPEHMNPRPDKVAAWEAPDGGSW